MLNLCDTSLSIVPIYFNVAENKKKIISLEDTKYDGNYGVFLVFLIN